MLATRLTLIQNRFIVTLYNYTFCKDRIKTFLILILVD